MIYIHVDMDGLDPREVPGHPLTVPGGPTSIELFLPASGGPLGSEATKHPIIFTRDIDEAHLWFSKQTSSTGPIQTNSAGNRFFVFRDLDENQIEVCRDTQG